MGPIGRRFLTCETGEKLKSRIRQLEEQLESVTGTPAFDDPTMPLPALGVLPIANPGLTSANFGTSSGDITFPGNHASSLFLGSNDAVESGLNAIPQTSMLAQLDCISQIQVQNQSTDNEWLLTDLGTPKTVLEHTQIYTPSMERGQRKPDYCQSPSRTRLPRDVGTSNHVQIGGNSGQSAHKMTSTLIAQNTGHETAQNSDATRLERLTLLAEHSRRLGFSSLNEALSVYYTSDVSKSAILSHEQSLSRVRHLPSFLSDIREHSKHWPTWERDNYVRETLRSAEDIYAEECRIARMNLSDQGLIGLTQKEFQFDQMIQITRVLQQEVCLTSLAPVVPQLLTHRV